MLYSYYIEKYGYKSMPKQVRKFIKERLGYKEMRELMGAIRREKWIVITGPTTSGKSTIGEILKKLGYPYVIDADCLVTIHTTDPLKELREKTDIFQSLGI